MRATPGWRALGALVGRHLLLVGISLGAAILIALPLGLGLERVRTAAEPVIRAVGAVQTIPSIALLAFMIPLLGIGVVPALVALMLYSIFPILRNTYTGIRDADQDKILIVIGTRDISCQTNLQSPLRKGTYVTMVIDPVAGAQPAQVTVVRVDSSGTLFNGGADEVTIDVVDDRIAGSVDFTTTDETDEGPVDLSVTGTFDVENCLL